MVAGTPTALHLTCPRCKTRRRFNTVDGATLYRCGGCEWYWTLGTPAVPVAPAVPASTVNATNTSAGIIAVTISGGTLTAVTVNAVVVGSTAGTYLVPAGGTINITYTVAPTWTWQLPVTSAQSGLGSSPFLPASVPVASGGAYLTSGMLLLVGAGAAAEVVQVNGTSTATSIPVTEGDKIVTSPPVPAAVTTPAVPASTVVQANTTGFDVSVVVTGGTMTNVSVNGFTVGAGAGTYFVPAGGTITMTYTVAPTWVWSGRVSVQSQYPHPVYATVAGGTMTRNIFVAPQGGALVDQAVTSGAILIPPYGTIQVQYSAAPTWVWNAPMGKLHVSGAVWGQLVLTSTLGGIGQDAVPANPPYGF